MKAPWDQNEEFIFMSEVVESAKETDFYIEIFPFSPDMECEGTPVRVIHNFDELIRFFEEDSY